MRERISLVMKLLKWFQRPKEHVLICGRAEGISQTLRLESTVLEHVEKSRQLNAHSTEAGGQLFGYINKSEIQIVLATGPYKRDQRGRYYYRSHETSAQKEIENYSKEGLFYLGEWHTHAEDFPTASSSDIDAMNKLLMHSKLNVNGLLMLIVGRSTSLSGYYISLFNGGHIYRWELYKENHFGNNH